MSALPQLIERIATLLSTMSETNCLGPAPWTGRERELARRLGSSKGKGKGKGKSKDKGKG